ncbi:prepilin-type cleavage/methylation protein [Vagococcus sp. BWB3-3]|uniref:Prepilin-type cleavage/methylation protein n=1 Tax=Vagococcus allomyrinae TaxID=2794353 RepID=A0A940PH42_9ENTE|nr:prepilin-type cleavage/methylation protein [Vagococcus allomyrinae]MBP1042803.1 prepilin-type cleavage/methylation protein [Vagococcus allomyrinae]
MGRQNKKTWRRRAYQRVKEEAGFSLIEIIAAVILLGSCFMLLATLIHQNSLAIQLNKRKEEAVFVRQDIKEWLSYKGQMDDLVSLNSYVLTQTAKTLTPEQKSRREHLILDDSGIQLASGSSKYGEVKVETAANRGSFVQKVKYYKDQATFLPESLRSADNQLYIGEYRNRGGEATDFLVDVTVKRDDAGTGKELMSYNPRREGLDLVIKVYDKKTGTLLTSTVMNWVVEA